MQFKRDTDYALRLLLCAARQRQADPPEIPVQVLSREAQVPLTIANRLCAKMVDAELLRTVNSAGNARGYLLSENAMSRTLYDVVCAIEGHSDLFAVFDQSTELFSNGQVHFQAAEGQFESALSKVTLQQLIEQ